MPEFPVSLEKPTKDIPQCSCSALKLPYNPNTELGGKVAMFYCFTLNNGVETPKNIDWTQLPATAVEIDTTDRCHLFCDKVNKYYLFFIHTSSFFQTNSLIFIMLQMLISITECKEGVWTGRPDKGFWCTEDPAINDATKKITCK